jgi:microsomal dipeptidase-like Zn-dependent dipeptidase
MKTTKASMQELVVTKDEVELIEDSVVLASDFLEEVMLPILDKFEFENDDPDYVPGMATHGLFVEMIARMVDAGYTEKDLRKEIKMYVNSSMGQTLH